MLVDDLEELEKIDVRMAYLRLRIKHRTTLLMVGGQLGDEFFVLGRAVDGMLGLRRHLGEGSRSNGAVVPPGRVLV